MECACGATKIDILWARASWYHIFEKKLPPCAGRCIRYRIFEKLPPYGGTFIWYSILKNYYRMVVDLYGIVFTKILPRTAVNLYDNIVFLRNLTPTSRWFISEIPLAMTVSKVCCSFWCSKVKEKWTVKLHLYLEVITMLTKKIHAWSNRNLDSISHGGWLIDYGTVPCYQFVLLINQPDFKVCVANLNCYAKVRHSTFAKKSYLPFAPTKESHPTQQCRVPQRLDALHRLIKLQRNASFNCHDFSISSFPFFTPFRCASPPNL